MSDSKGTPVSQSVKAHEKRKAEIKMQVGARCLQGEGQRASIIIESISAW